MGHFLTKFLESPSSKTTGLTEKNQGVVKKWYRHPLSWCKVWWRSATARWHEKEKLGVFVFFLFVTLWILNLNKGLAHQMWMSAFTRRRNALSNVWKDIWTMQQGGTAFVLELGQKIFFLKIQGHSLCARLRPFRRRIEKKSTTTY